MLDGFMFYLAVRSADDRAWAGLRAVCVVVIGLVGFGRIWIQPRRRIGGAASRIHRERG